MSWGIVGGAAVLGITGAISGEKQAKAIQAGAGTQLAGIEKGIEETRRASEAGLEFLAPFGELGLAGIEQAD